MGKFIILIFFISALFFLSGCAVDMLSDFRYDYAIFDESRFDDERFVMK